MSGPVLFAHAKRGGAMVRVTIAEYSGVRFLDFREWVDREGELLATRKGATMPLSAMRELGEALIAASRLSDSSGPPSGS